GPINQIFYDGRRLSSLVPIPLKIQIPSSGPKEIGEFLADVIHFLWKKSKFNSNSVINHEYLKKYCKELLELTRLSFTTVIISIRLFQKYLIVADNDINYGFIETYLVSLILADKYHNDHKFSNRTWADITKIKFMKINEMELTFLKCFNFQIYLNEEDFKYWLDYYLINYLKAQLLLNMNPPTYIEPIKKDIQDLSNLIIIKKEEISFNKLHLVPSTIIIEHFKIKEKVNKIKTIASPHTYPRPCFHPSPLLRSNNSCNNFPKQSLRQKYPSRFQFYPTIC
ncbi:7034_t:CDS:2, partial [Diversispora eburnea]